MDEGSSDTPLQPHTPAAYTCPHCGQTIAASPPDAGPFVICPLCGQEFTVPGSSDDADAQLAAEKEADESAEEQLSALRVRELSRGRRAMIRGRSWMIIALVVCIAVAGELAQRAINSRTASGVFDFGSIIKLVCTVIALVFAAILGIRARVITRELSRRLLEEPTAPPDFTPLNDGSQQWKNLDRM